MSGLCGKLGSDSSTPSNVASSLPAVKEAVRLLLLFLLLLPPAPSARSSIPLCTLSRICWVRDCAIRTVSLALSRASVTFLPALFAAAVNLSMASPA